MATCASCGTELPAEARFCPGCGAPAEAPPVSAAEERKLATVLFADLVGSTELGEQDPERTRVLLDRFYDAMAAEIGDAGGTVEKFAGDAVMAAFGAPAALEDHAERALHAALSMQRRLEAPLQLRIGVNTGEVVVGRPREGSSFVTGDAVNVAARLEQAALPGEILVGERTVSAARGAFEFDEPRTVEVKGKSSGVVCRRVVRALTLMRPRGVGGLHEAFVGRDTEIELLRATYRRVVDREEPHLVTIMGDAGVGKTRLIRELWQLLAEESPEPMRRTGRCLSYGHGITYWPLAEILKEHLWILDTDSPETVLERLSGREILGLALGLDVAADLHPLAARERLHEAATEFLDALTAERPVVMLVEDLHWAEEELLDLLDRLLLDVRGPLFLIGTSRPEILDTRPAWGGGRRNASLLGLEPLSERQTAQLVSELLAAKLPDRVCEALVERAGGNPFFVEEVVGTLIDRGLLARSNGTWTARELPEGFEIPDSVQAVLAARIDLLPPAEKAALQAAAVIGRTFWAGPVRELLDGAEPDFGLLEERDFIRRRSGSSMLGEREFAIKHALTREVAYASLPKARRARLHAAFARWMERAGEARDEYAALLGHHYAAAVNPEDADLAWTGEEAELERLRENALIWLERAGDLAGGRYEIDDALALFHRALELGPDEAKESELWRKIGQANALKFDGEAFWTAMQNSLKTCLDRETCAETYSWLAFHTTARSGMWKRRPDRELVEGWIEQALELAPPESPARARALISSCYWSHTKSQALPAEASAIANRIGDLDLRSYALEARAVAAFANQQYPEALSWEQRRFDLLDQITDPDHLHDLYCAMIPVCIANANFGEARRIAHANEELCSTLSAHHRLHGVGILMEVYELTGEWDRVRELLPDLRERVRLNLATPCIRNSRSLLIGAVASAYLDDEQQSRALEEEANDLGMEGYEEVLSGPLIRLALARGDLESVERMVADPLGMLRQTWFFPSGWAARLEALVALEEKARVEGESQYFLKPESYFEPFVLRALGQVREDDELIRQALERFEAMGLDWHAEQTRALLTPA